MCKIDFHEPFTAHQSHYSGSRLFGYNLPATIARELFKPSTDAGRLLGSILKKNFWFGWWVRLGEARKVGALSVFWPTLTGRGRQSHGPKFWLKLFVETRWSPTWIEPLLDLLACLEPKLWPKKNILPPKSENCRKCMSLPLASTVARDNSALEDARELYEPSKDSWNLLVCTEKKTF